MDEANERCKYCDRVRAPYEGTFTNYSKSALTSLQDD